MTNITLRRHLTEAALDPNLVYLIEDIASSCRVVANTVRNGAFEDNLGSRAEVERLVTYYQTSNSAEL